MPKIILGILILMTSAAFGQNYKLFNSNSKKLYTDFPIANKTYSISFESAYSSLNDSIFINFFKYNPNGYPSNFPNCSPPISICYKQNIPSWIGKKVVYDNISLYKFFNKSNDTLHFNFTLNTLDTSLFYSDSIQKFQLVYFKSDTLNVLNTIDSARFYTIIHSDLLGNSVNSVLNQQKIIVSKNFGLVTFFRVDSFPLVLNPVILIGNESPDAGIVKLTNEIIYDYQVGDVFQYNNMRDEYDPNSDYNYYSKNIILSKTLTSDSIFYTVVNDRINNGSSICVRDTFLLEYCRNTVIDQIPFEKYTSDGFSFFGIKDYCGLKLWTYTLTDNNGGDTKQYCYGDTSWCIHSIGPPIHRYKQIVVGLGEFDQNSFFYTAPPSLDSWYQSSRLIYFKKNGVSCGTEILVGINEDTKMELNVVISPNPVSSYLNVTSSNPFKEITLFNVEGQVVLSQQINGINSKINIEQLNDGIYIVRILLENNSIVVKKIVKIDD